MCLDPFKGDLAEQESPKVPIFALEQGSGTNVADAAGKAKGQVLGVNDRKGVTGAARNPNDSG